MVAVNAPVRTGAPQRKPIAVGTVAAPIEGTGLQNQAIRLEVANVARPTLQPFDNYTVSAAKPGFLSATYGSHGQSKGAAIAVRAGEVFARADIRLRRLGSISGRLTDVDGNAVSRAYIRAIGEVDVAGARRLAISGQTKTEDR